MPPHGRELRRRVWQLAAPALVEMVTLSLVQVLQLAIVGRLGPTAVAAVGLPIQPIFLAMSLIFALNVGTTALVARSVGARRPELAQRTFTQSWLLSGLTGLVMAAFFYVFAHPIIAFMGGSGEVQDLASAYLRILSPSLLLLSMAMTTMAALRGCGDTRTVSLINGSGNVLAVALSVPLIYGYLGVPPLGAAGAAWAQVAARCYMFAACLWVLRRPRSPLRLDGRGWRRLDLPTVRQVLAIGLPSAGEQFLLQSGLILFVRTVAGMGTETLAAHQIVGNILGLSFQPGLGFAVAATTLAGQYLGARQPELAEAAVRQAGRFGIAVGAAMAVVFIAAGPWIMALYTSEPEVIRQGALALKVIGAIQPLQAAQLIQAGGLRGAGATRGPLLSTALGIWVVRPVVLALAVGHWHWGLVGAWLAAAADQVARWCLVRYLFLRGNWKRLPMGL